MTGAAGAWRAGIDIGGTFTDIALLRDDGLVVTAKVSSTPDDYSRGIADGLGAVLTARGIDPAAVAEVIHGTTVATNAILERKGVRTGLVTTEGFRDVLEIRRLRMPRLYDLAYRKPPTLVRRADRVEVRERIDHLGAVVRPLDEAQARDAIRALLAQGVETVAVCLFNAYADGRHEQRVRELIREQDPDIPVCLSSEVLPEIREYERTSTTVVNAYIVPVVGRYLRRLSSALGRLGIRAPLAVMQSNGGTMGAEAASGRPIHIIESGPAAGVVGAAALADRLGFRDVLTFDMGGTTAKASMIEDGRFDRLGELDVGAGINAAGRLLKGGGYHVRVPAIDLAEVGAGGGSLVLLDAGGAVRVGPESAGAVPGPVAYGLGGSVPTVTDANLVLGFLNPGWLAGGAVRLDREAAEAALGRTVAEPLGVSVEEAAWGVHAVANAAMARALRAVSSERGRDPRRFSLMTFGGSGPVHAATLARSLGIRTLLLPPLAGVFSALGLLFPETEHHYVRTLKGELTRLEPGAIDAVFVELEAEGERALGAEGYARDRIGLERLADLRYRGENSELTVPLARTAEDLPALAREAFEDAHERTYGYRSAEERVELVSVRVIARGQSDTARMPERLAGRAGEGTPAPPSERRVYFGPARGWMPTPVLADRAQIPEAGADGPLVIEEYDSTIVVPPGCRVRREAWETLVMDVAQDA